MVSVLTVGRRKAQVFCGLQVCRASSLGIERINAAGRFYKAESLAPTFTLPIEQTNDWLIGKWRRQIRVRS